MRVRSAQLRELQLPLVEPFETSFGVERRRRFLLLRLEAADGRVGFGECVAAPEPLYSSETLESSARILRHHLVPELLRRDDDPRIPFDLPSYRFRGHRMAKAALEAALVDLRAQEKGVPLARALGAVRGRVEVGVSVGIQPSVAGLVRRVAGYLEEGYRRVKLKVRPGWDVVPLRAVRKAFPDLELWVDANQAYPAPDRERIRAWAERYGVAQVEQPFDERAIRAHARLARGARFRVCLDESIVGRSSLDDALAARALTALNVKVGRVGGVTEAIALARAARRARIPAWIGGMLESGVGRALNVHLAARREFTLPGDISASDRYYGEDLIEPPFRLGRGSTLDVPRGPGLGVEVLESRVRRATRRTWTLRP